jgi:hypothetical protein
LFPENGEGDENDRDLELSLHQSFPQIDLWT